MKKQKFDLSQYFSDLGSRKSAAKTRAARENGKKGGRPPKKKRGAK